MQQVIRQFHGLNLALAAQPPVLAALAGRLGRFPEGRKGGAPDLEFVFQGVRELGPALGRPRAPGRPVLAFAGGGASYHEETGELFVDLGRHGRVLCDTRGKRAQVYYREGQGEEWLVAHPLFTIPMGELLKREGLFMVHAAGLTAQGRGLLAAGASGSGKTTLTLALVRAGFGFQGDDTVFLKEAGAAEGWKALAFPDEVDITAQTGRFFPELAGLGPAEGGRRKRAVCATEVYGVAPSWEARVWTLVFPQPSKERRSQLRPMSPGEALVHLACNVVRTDPEAAQAHLDALAGMVRQVQCHRLEAGQDFEDQPGLMREALGLAPQGEAARG